jgi:anti-sigma B factor antagonist
VELSLTSREVGSAQVVAVAGEIDVYTSPRLRERLVTLVNGGATAIVVDLEQVDFIDSTGLGVLVGVLKRLRARGGTMSVVCRQEGLLRVFRITGLDKVFAIHDTVADAAAGRTADSPTDETGRASSP